MASSPQSPGCAHSALLEFDDMKKSNILKPLYLLVALAGFSGFVNAAPFGPDGRATRWVQPNGESIELRMFGDNHYARTETPEGFTVIHNPETGAYHYAELSADGSALVPSATLAGAPVPAGQLKHVDRPKAKILEMISANRAFYDGGRQERWMDRVQSMQLSRVPGIGPRRAPAAQGAHIPPVPIIGNQIGLTILVQFPDDTRTSGADPVNFPATRNKIIRFCNDVGYTEDGNTGSIRDYFFDQSLGKLTYTQTVTEIITVPRARNFYNFSDYPTNRVLRGDASRLLIADAVEVLRAQGFDFNGLTTDASGNAVATNVFFAGPDSGVFLEGLWPQQWNLPVPISVGTGSTPVSIFKFQITNAEDAAPVIGTFCHENGHLLLDYPDIYANFPNGEGVGMHCLMGSGNLLDRGRTPAPINAYFKEIVGWAKVSEVSPLEFRTARLTTTGNVAVRVTNPLLETEFFMVENRGEGDKWAKFCQDTGILIWHVDETIDGNFRGGPHYGVALEQADGREDLENNANLGDATDLFDLATSKFNDTTTPNANWWDGTSSGVEVEVLTNVGPSTTVLFGGVPPNAIIVSSPNGGEVVYPGSSLPIIWQANITGSVRIDLFKGGLFSALIAASEPNDGTYTWRIPATLAPGEDYTIQISSIANPVPVSDSSDADFEINDTTFPADGKIPFGWFKPDGAATGWEVTKSVTFEGATSLVSINPGDGRVSAIAYSANFVAGEVSFYFRVSSEQGYDFARFSIDGVRQVFPTSTSKGGLSGKVGWTFVSFPVSSGNHTFKWTYDKDDSYAGGSDRAWLDGVALPDTTQEIAVFNSKGDDLVDGGSTISFSDVTIQSSSPSKTLTIKNVGKATLFGLEVSKTGRNRNDFTVQPLKATLLAPGESTTFKVTFSPIHVGPLEAGLRILSNDADEENFNIDLEGTGLGIPDIGVFLGSDKPLKDDGPLIDFGFAVVGTKGNTRTFTIKNQGSAPLLGLDFSRFGANKGDFEISSPDQTTLDPGASTTFRVTFRPSARNERKGQLRILSNDKRSGPFDLNFSGIGAPKSSARANKIMSAALGNSKNGQADFLLPLTSMDVVDGQKYLALTVTKQPNGSAGTVEVSPNLLDWYSGEKHTTILIDDAKILRVRDNSPVSKDVKRFIRIK